MSPVSNSKPKVLVVGMLDSIHLARWLSQLVVAEFEILVTGTSPYRKIRRELQELAERPDSNIRIAEIFPRAKLAGLRIFPALAWILDRLFQDRIRGYLLSRLIARSSPALIHVNELQVAGYPTVRALNRLRDSTIPLWSTNYGSEIVWYSKFASHKNRLSALLQRSSFFSAECNRDSVLATQLGFRGIVFPTYPVSGGIEPLKSMTPSSHRTKIAVKGYDNKWGMGSEALRATWLAVEGQTEREIEIVAFSCNRPTLRQARALNGAGRTRIVTYPKGALSHTEMIALFSNSLAYVGASRSDGISTSVIEAMSAGAFPIQTDSSCSSEWLSHNQTGYLVPAGALETIEEAVAGVLAGKYDLEESRRANARKLLEKADPTKLRALSINSYRQALKGSTTS